MWQRETYQSQQQLSVQRAIHKLIIIITLGDANNVDTIVVW